MMLLLALATSSSLVVRMNAEIPSTADTWLKSLQTPEFHAPASREAWPAQQAEIRQTLRGLLGEFPPRPDVPAVKVLSQEAGAGYTLEKFSFENGLGELVKGYLFLPAVVRGKVPAILYCHWHGGQYDIGKQEMLQTNATPVPPGPTLARLGYAVLGIDASCFGERNGAGPDGPSVKGSAGELSASKFQLWAGRTLWGLMVRDDQMALDYLCSRPEVDARRIGVTGISMGSTRAWWLMALDDRPKAAVCVACMTRYEDLMREGNLKAHGIYFFVPGMLRHFDTEAVIACAAPRPILFMTGDKDAGSPIRGVQRIAERVSALYDRLGKPDAFCSEVYPDVGHVYLPGMWEKTVTWFDRHLRE